MEQDFQTSFIPKKPIVEERAISSRKVGPFTILAIFIFFTIVLVAGGLYFYKGILTNNITKMENDLVLAKGRFEPETISRLQVLDKRLRASDKIISNHLTISPIFQALQDLTMKTVRYTKFSYGINDSGKMNVKMSGQAIGYRSIALQSELFTQNKNLIDPIFSNLSLDEKGNVLFDLEFSVSQNFVNYQQTLLTASGNSSGVNQSTGTTE